MANLLGQNIGTNYKGILNLGSTINIALSGTLQAITDGDGVASPLQLSTTIVNVNTKLGVDLGAFAPLAPIHVGDNNVNRSVDSVILASRLVNDTGSMSGINGHCFSDSSDISRTGGVGYASYDARYTATGGGSYDHFANFQSAGSYATSGTTSFVYGYWHGSAISGGNITNDVGVFIADANLTGGTITNQYGIKISDLTKGTNKYALYIEGNNPIVTYGSVGIGDIPANIFQISTAKTTTASNQQIALLNSAITTRATASDVVSSLSLSPTFTAGANTQRHINLLLNATYNIANDTTYHIGIKAAGFSDAMSNAIPFWAVNNNNGLSVNLLGSRTYIAFTNTTVPARQGTAGVATFNDTGILIGGTGNAESHLHIAAGTTSQAPLKLTSGTNLTTPQNGSFEYDGTNLYFTTGGTRKTVTLI
jgi:hypothetical protein